MEILTLIGVECHTFDGEFVDSVGLDCHEIMRWWDADLRWIARKPAQGLPSTLCWMWEVVLGPWSETVGGIYFYQILVFSLR